LIQPVSLFIFHSFFSDPPPNALRVSRRARLHTILIDTTAAGASRLYALVRRHIWVICR
jgi:hypothetical protein